MPAVNNNRLLKSSQEIMEAYDLSRPAFQKFIGLGLPARRIDGKWYAHMDNIDDFFRKLTRVSTRIVPEDVAE